MKKLIGFTLAFVVALVMTGCGSYKQVTYFQNIDSISLAASKGLHDTRIMPKDMLTILVSTTDPKAAIPFNLSYNQSTSAASNGSNSFIPYLVDNDGCINFPVLGRLCVVGLTKREVENLVAQKIKPYLAAGEVPVVTVTMSNYNICVIGEVRNPGVFTINNEKVSVIEALTRAGDLTIQGKRQNILLIREGANGQKEHHRLNL
ncbi:MAG: polysaccharide biosynthesis/export family protein, partial [Bacteroidaceae bacterium]|nr:polysaccharide biosynthesis/export family protein [Bacteroidaceae bacterium]